ncbi:MAG: ATP-binding protein [Planctomycetota bacterium]
MSKVRPDAADSHPERQRCPARRARSDSADDVLRAIREHEVDALVVSFDGANQIFTIESAEAPYRHLVECIGEGALVVAPDGAVLFANQRFTEFSGWPLERLIGAQFEEFAEPPARICALLAETAAQGSGKCETQLHCAEGRTAKVMITATPLPGDERGRICLAVTDLSLLKHAEAMASAEAAIRAAALFPEQNPNPVLRLDLEGTLLFANPASAPLLRLWNCAVAGRVPAEVWQAARAALGSEAPQPFDLPVGDRVYLVACAPIRAAGYVNLYLTDVTARYRAEQELRRNQERFELLSAVAGELLASPVPRAIIDELCERALRVLNCQVYFNYLLDPASGRLHLNACGGMAPADAPALESLDLGAAICGCVARDGQRIVAEDIQNTNDPLPALVRSFGVQAYACHPLVRGGAVIGTLSFGTRTRPRFTNDELSLMKAVAALIAIALDRVRTEARTHESETRLAAHMANSPVAVIEWSPDFRIIRWAGEAERIFGWPAAEVVGHPIDDLNIVYTGDVAAVADVMARLRHGPDRHVFSANRNFTRDRRVIHCEWHNSRLVDERGELAGILSLVMDVTARNELQRQRDELLEAERAARGEAERAGRLKDEFLATLSHELRTPLNAVLGWAQMLRRGTLEQEEAREAIAVIERNARMQKQLIEDLLDMSRIVSGKFRLDVRPVNLREVLDSAVAAVQPALDAKGVLLERTLPAVVGPVLGDPGRLQQVFWNLLANAVKFTPRGGKVCIQAAHEDAQVVLRVADTGAGIKPDFLPHLFERFRQADGSTTRRYRGLGLGLSIVKQLVELHGGTVSATSPGENKGATFCVTLPLTMGPALEDCRATPARAVLSDGPRLDPALQNVTVLVVEDEPDARDLLRRVLEEAKATVLVADCAAAALAVLARAAPDVLVSDIGLPDEDGHALLRRIRALPDPALARIPAVAVTAFARSEDRARAVLSGYHAHLAKPVDPLELVGLVASLAPRRGEVTHGP